MAGLVIGGQLLLFFRHDHGLALGAHHDLVARILELLSGDDALAASRREQRRFVDEVHQIGAREAGRAARDHLEVDVGRERHLADVDAQDLLAADEVGVRDHDLAVETARAQQRGIEHVGPVGRGDDDDAFVLLEAVHLDQQLVQRLLALVVAAAEAGAAMAADRVDFVDEDDAGRVLLGLLEHVAHAARADADEHFDEVRTGDGEERHVGFARHRASGQRLTGAGRADQQHAARDTPAELLEFLRIAQELDDLLQIFLGLVDAGDVLEGDAALRLGQQLGFRLAKSHRLAGAALHLARHIDPHAEEQQQRQTIDKQGQHPGIAIGRRLGRDRNALVIEVLHQHRIARRVGLERAAILVVAGNVRTRDGDVANVAAIDLGQQLAEHDFAAGRLLRRALEQSNQRQNQQEDDHPEGEISQIGVHRIPIGRDSGRNFQRSTAPSRSLI